MPAQPGLGSADLLDAATAAAMTSEQRLRGTDGVVSSAVLVTGYDRAAIEAVGRTSLAASALSQRGAQDLSFATYRTDYSLAAAELR
jgi:ABC-type proline/glycine betaine transport system permease subunit